MAADPIVQAQQAAEQAMLAAGSPISAIEKALTEPTYLRAQESIAGLQLIIKHSMDSRAYKQQLEAFGMKDNSGPVVACAMVDVGQARINDFVRLIERMQTYVIDYYESLG